MKSPLHVLLESIFLEKEIWKFPYIRVVEGGLVRGKQTLKQVLAGSNHHGHEPHDDICSRFRCMNPSWAWFIRTSTTMRGISQTIFCERMIIENLFMIMQFSRS